MSSSDLSLKWNPKHLEIKTRTVERTLEPLVMQVTTLVSRKIFYGNTKNIWVQI